MLGLQSADSLDDEPEKVDLSGKKHEEVLLGYLNGIWRDRGSSSGYVSTANQLLLALELQTGSIRDSTSEGADRRQKLSEGIEEIFGQTRLRRFEFLYIVSRAINQGHLEKELFDVPPFCEHLENFRKYWKQVLTHIPDTRLYDSRILHVKEC